MSISVLRIAGVSVPVEKHIVIGLTSIYGIGNKLAREICKATNINPQKKGSEMASEEETALRAEVAKHLTEGELRRKVASDKMRLLNIKCYRGQRHRMKLPCRGQNTRNNAKTAGRAN